MILLLALLPRLGAIDRYITPDELHWVDRSIKFSTAIAHGQWRDTIQSGHPGVTTMWLGSLGINLQHALDPALPDPAQAPTFAAQNPNASRQLAQYLSAARLPVILVSALNIMLLFLLLSRKLKRWIAFLAAGLVALDPFAVGLGGILHVDSLLATFSLISLAALWIALDQAKPTKWLILSGLLAGLTALTKSPAIVLGPIALIAIGLNDFRRQPIGHMLRSMVIWGLSATAIFFALYPAMWVAPFAALGRMAGTAERFSEQAHAVNYFFGSHDRDPGALFYPAVIAYRSTPILWAGLVTTLGLILRARSDDEKRLRAASLLYGLFAILFVGLITVGAKKLDRYVFPALLALDIVGAMGLAFAIEKLAAIRQRVPALVLAASISLCLLITAAQFTSVWPLTLWAYNPILGGYDGASRALPVGGGESAEIGAALSASPYASKRIAISDIVGAAPFFAGDLVPNDETGYTRADYILLTAPDFQLTPESSQAWSDSITPVLTVTVQNRAFAWLYPNRWLADDRQRLLKDRGPGDALITDYAADLPTQAGDPMIVLPGDTDEASAIDLLTRVAASHTRVFFIHYSASPRRTTTAILRLLDTFAVKLDEWSSPLSEGALYALPQDVSFSATPVALNANVTFGDHIRLTQAALIAPHVRPGQSIGLATEWIADPPDAKVFVSLVDAAGHVWSQGDAQVPIVQTAGTPRAKRISVPAPLVIPPGTYQLTLNVLDLNNGAQLGIHDANNTFAGLELPLGSVTIDPAQTFVDLETRRPPITLKADLGGLRAIGSDVPPDPIITGDPWTLTMDWVAWSENLPTLDIRWLVSAGNQTTYSVTLPLSPYPTDRWRKGEVIESKYDFRLPITLPDATYQLQFQLIDPATGQPIVHTPTVLSGIHVASRARAFTPPGSIGRQLGVQFGDLATLLGADVSPSSAQPGQSIKTALYWQARSITATSYTVFIHVLGPDGQPVIQVDNWQIGRDSPTSTWLPNQVIADPYTLTLPADAPAGEYQVWVGLYNAADGQRLPAIDSRGNHLPQDRAALGSAILVTR